MTIKNKIFTSIATAALLSTSAYAAGCDTATLTCTNPGTLQMVGGAQTTIASELFQPGANLTVSAIGLTGSELSYTANVSNPQAVSDPLFQFTFNSPITLAGVNELYVVDAAGTIVAGPGVQDAGNPQMLKFNGDSNVDVDNGKTYRILASSTTGQAVGTILLTPVAVNTEITMSVSKADVDATSSTVDLELWSTSGTPSLADKANLDIFASKAEYTVACENKIDNLINVEDASETFVSTRHGAVDGASGGVNYDFRDSMINDVLVFNVSRAAGIDYSVGDNQGSIIAMDLGNNNQALFDTGAVTLIDINDVSTAAAWTIVDNSGPLLSSMGHDLEIESSAVLAPGASSTFTLAFTTNETAPIPVEDFTGTYYIGDAGSSSDTLVAALASNPNGIAGYIPEGGVNGTADATNQKIGAWAKFAYIAQIAGATETNITKTKLFIANRSCATVTPQVTLIQNGKTVTVPMSSIAADTQLKETLGTVIANNTAAITAAGLTTTGNYAIEITIPGNAEDFYVYAQAFNATDGITKDLPVYNTSTRD